jgi:hypothetical protein
MTFNNALKLGTILAAIALLASLAVVAPVAAQSTSPYELNAILPLTGNLAFVRPARAKGHRGTCDVHQRTRRDSRPSAARRFHG